jgi:hypothetical protein
MHMKTARSRTSFLLILALLAAAGVTDGCKDMGVDPPAAQPSGGPLPSIKDTVSFLKTVRPLLASSRAGCLGCHGGTNDLFVGTVASLLGGGLHGPAVVPGNSAGSLLIQKMGPAPPFGQRMPQGGIPLPDSTIQLIKNWIDQGALDN